MAQKSIPLYLVAFGIALIALILSLYLGHDGGLKLETFIAVSGLIVTVLSFALGGLFAALAVSAYAHVREISERRESVEETHKAVRDIGTEITRTAGDTKDVAAAMVSLMYEMYSEQLFPINSDSDHSESSRERRARQQNELLRRRALLAVKYRALDSLTRTNLVRELLTCGKQDDLTYLSRLMTDNNESAELRELAKIVHDAIEIRMP